MNEAKNGRKPSQSKKEIPIKITPQYGYIEINSKPKGAEV